MKSGLALAASGRDSPAQTRLRGADKPLDTTCSNPVTRYDPGQVPADPAKIWQGVLGTLRKSTEISP